MSKVVLLSELLPIALSLSGLDSANSRGVTLLSVFRDSSGKKECNIP